MKKYYILLLVALTCLSATAASSFLGKVEELKSIAQFKVSVENEKDKKKVHLEGTIAESSYSFDKAEYKTDGTTLTVLIHSSLASKGTSGTFSIDTEVPATIDKIVMGNKKVEIWPSK